MKVIKEVLEKVYNNSYLRKKTVPLFLGNPGLGKTVMIDEFAKAQGVQLVELITSQMSPFEISGICIPSHETKKMVYYNFDRLDDLKDGDILFFDELLNGNPTVLNACLTVLEQRRMISGKPLPDIMIVAAANPQGMVPLTPQIKERFIWYDVKFDTNMWKTYMRNKYFMPASICNKLSDFIIAETFTGINFYTPRSIEKAVNMIINHVPTPYYERINPVLSELITNPLEEEIKLNEDKILMPNEKIMWIELIRCKYEAGSNLSTVNPIIDNFVLPKYWYVEITIENFDIIYKHYKSLGVHWNKDNGFGLSHKEGSDYWRDTKPDSKYKLLSLEQFRKYVLKENI